MQQNRRTISILPYLVVVLALILLFGMQGTTNQKALSYTELQQVIQEKDIKESVISIGNNVVDVSGKYNEGEQVMTFTSTVPATDQEIENLLGQLEGSKISIVDTDESNLFLNTLISLIPFVFVVLLGLWMMNRMSGAGSANARAFEFGKSRAHLETKSKVRFTDVAGCDEEKQEMQEIIDYLKYPKKFQTMGARIPKGILLVGHPGTGKTLLAKAVAGEANVPFYSISGSDFVEMFVGVGASRVRDMFKKAQQTAP